MSAVWFTRQGHRRVEQIISDGRRCFLVRDPRTSVQAPDATGIVPIFTRTAGEAVIFARRTINGLAALGVKLEDLVTDAPEITPRPMRRLPRITRQAGQSASDVQEQRYHVFLAEFTADVAAAKASGEPL